MRSKRMHRLRVPKGVAVVLRGASYDPATWPGEKVVAIIVRVKTAMGDSVPPPRRGRIIK